MYNGKRCAGYRDMLTLRYYGELGSDEAAALDAHLADCGPCRTELECLTRTLDAVRPETPAPGAAACAADGVMRRLGRRRPAAGRLVPAFAAMAAAVAAVIYVLHTGAVSPVTPPPGPVVMASADMEMLDNLDVLGDLDVLESLDTLDEMNEL